jgi:hypothetical protein
MLGSLEIGSNIKRRDLNVATLGLLTHERVLRVSLSWYTLMILTILIGAVYDVQSPNVGVGFTNSSTRGPP